MADKEDPSSSWWGYASSAWNAVQETAKDFTDAFQEENEETIQQIKSKVDADHISNQISSATDTINTFLNTTVTTINTTLNQQNTASLQQDIILKKQISPKPFEKEKATYSLDPLSIKQHKDKYNTFIEKELGLSDDEICVKGRHLLEINGAIRTYFQQLVPEEIDEITFWKRYFYWKYNNQLREILISRHTKPNKPDIESDHEEEEEQEVKLGDCENAKIAEEVNEDVSDNKVEKVDKTNGNTDEYTSTSDYASGSKFSETSWNQVVEDTKTMNEVNVKGEKRENDVSDAPVTNDVDPQESIQITQEDEKIDDVDLNDVNNTNEDGDDASIAEQDAKVSDNDTNEQNEHKEVALDSSDELQDILNKTEQDTHDTDEVQQDDDDDEEEDEDWADWA